MVKMSDLPRISIVMPSYNQSQFIEESIQSILEQNYPSLEFMIYDGGSTDGSQEIIQRYASHLAFWQSGPDKGQTDALIQGFERATGDLLGWVNSDDVLLPGALQSIAQAYGSNPECGLIGGNFIMIDKIGRIIRCIRLSRPGGVLCPARPVCILPAGQFFQAPGLPGGRRT